MKSRLTKEAAPGRKPERPSHALLKPCRHKYAFADRALPGGDWGATAGARTLFAVDEFSERFHQARIEGERTDGHGIKRTFMALVLSRVKASQSY
jgi:hypothetical protein